IPAVARQRVNPSDTAPNRGTAGRCAYRGVCKQLHSDGDAPFLASADAAAEITSDRAVRAVLKAEFGDDFIDATGNVLVGHGRGGHGPGGSWRGAGADEPQSSASHALSNWAAESRADARTPSARALHRGREWAAASRLCARANGPVSTPLGL